MPEVQVKNSKRIFLCLRIAVVFCGIAMGVYWVNRDVGWKNLAKAFRSINLGVFTIVLVVFILSQMIIGLRWWLLLRYQSIFISLWAAVRLYLLGWFYNNFMPGSLGGDLLRAWYVTKHTDKKFEAVLSVFVDRVIGLSSTLVIAVFFYLLFLQDKGLELTGGGSGLFKAMAKYRAVFFWIIVTLAVILCLLLLYKKTRPVLLKAFSHINKAGLRMILKFKNAFVIYCKKPFAILLAFGLTVFLQMLAITAFWLLGRNMGIQADVKYYYIFFTLTWILGAVPVSIAGAFVVEGTLAYLFITFAGVSKESASALALCQRVVWMLASLPGAAIHLIGAHLPKAGKRSFESQKDFFIDYEKSTD